MLAVLLMDIDRFKTINDHYGHDVGDRILCELSNRLLEWNKERVVIARLGGDEYALLIMGAYTQSDIKEFCNQLIELCSRQFYHENEILTITVSIGVALFSEEAKTANTIIRNADIAMYLAKSQGYNKYQFYNSISCKTISNKNEIEVLLSQIDIENELELVYQPLFSLPDLKLVGAEALLRWKSPAYGYIPPGLFIPVSEETDMILKIGRWVMHQAMKQASEWNNQLDDKLKISFNVSVKQLKDNDFIAIIKSLMLENKTEVEWLDAEITESAMVSTEFKVGAVFELLRKAGLTITIDDFGSGYSALGYLNNYAFDKIKIDKSMIDNLGQYNIAGENIVKAVIALAKSVGVVTVAEGVETQEQLDILLELGCDLVQGYLLGRPVPPDVFEERFFTAKTRAEVDSFSTH